MKKVCVILIFVLLLSGCSGALRETVSDDYELLQSEPKEILLEISQAQQLQNGSEKVYLCDGFEVATVYFDTHDAYEALCGLSGFSAEALPVIQTRDGAWTRYDTVWTAASDEGEQIFRVVVFDDGQYLYGLLFSSAAEASRSLLPVWQSIADGVSFA